MLQIHILMIMRLIEIIWFRCRPAGRDEELSPIAHIWKHTTPDMLDQNPGGYYNVPKTDMSNAADLVHCVTCMGVLLLGWVDG